MKESPPTACCRGRGFFARSRSVEGRVVGVVVLRIYLVLHNAQGVSDFTVSNRFLYSEKLKFIMICYLRVVECWTEGDEDMKKITIETIQLFKCYLCGEEKAQATVNKYVHDVKEFQIWLGDRELCKTEVLAYKNYLCERYAPASVNAVLSSLNSFWGYMEWFDLRVKNLKIQKQIFASSDKELTKAEYERLLQAAKQKKNERLYLLLQTMCATGIRVSELRDITVAAVSRGVAEINCKGKCRQVFLPKQLCRILKQYIKDEKIKSGPVFVTKNGNPLDRSNIWSDMKKLCKAANVSEKKVFPHNLRHLFARTYYHMHRDVVRLADILGHSSVNTTRVYTMETGEVHRRQIQKLGLCRAEYTT